MKKEKTLWKRKRGSGQKKGYSHKGKEILSQKKAILAKESTFSQNMSTNPQLPSFRSLTSLLSNDFLIAKKVNTE